MSNLEYNLNNLYNNIETIKRENIDILTEAQLTQLNNLLDGTDLASKQDPSFFYKILQDYKIKVNTLLSEFYTELENIKKFESGTTILIPEIDDMEIVDMETSINYNCDSTCTSNNKLKKIPYSDENKRKILELKYDILQNNIEILRTYIRAEREVLGDTINDMRNNEHFATTLNSDYSEIYKYKYLRNWGIFLSILGGAYFFKKMK